MQPSRTPTTSEDDFQFPGPSQRAVYARLKQSGHTDLVPFDMPYPEPIHRFNKLSARFNRTVQTGTTKKTGCDVNSAFENKEPPTDIDFSVLGVPQPCILRNDHSIEQLLRIRGRELGLPAAYYGWLCGDDANVSAAEEGLLLTAEFFYKEI
ncbi:hypothetical protein K491DRAFT_718826 [Lophiostoma macrostomum CBS 122681]|uniref:Uncharacterized protein n=1 Tax=Lophiostoma macrostomum CBS 122681 TaxID=1314788 RepID=A0A6A6SZP6_9PLEO|nr:hypothetical protein K491DRAFT_718826 [Lophiostoma macrostomum CBS 122681]